MAIHFKKTLLVLLAAASLAGCKKQDASVAGEVVLNHHDMLITQGPQVDEEIRLFQIANPGIKIKKTTIAGERYPDLFALAQKSGESPDTFVVPGRPTFPELVANGWLLPLNGFEDYKDFEKQFPPNCFVEGVNVIKGKTYSVAQNVNIPFLQLWINTKVFRDAGLVTASGAIKEPKTLDEVLAFSRQIKKSSNGTIFGLGYSGKHDPLSWFFWMNQFSGFPQEAFGLNYKTGKYEFAKHESVKIIANTLLTMRKEGLVLPQAASVDDETARVLFAQGKYGMLVNGSWVINGWKQTNPEFKDYTVVPLPLVGVDKIKGYFYYGPGGASVGISPLSKHPKEAWLWFKWQQSKEASLRWVKSGNGPSIYKEFNTPENLNSDAMARVVAMVKLGRIGPQPGIRNPDTALVKIPNVKPDEAGILEGYLTGQITDLQAALVDLDARKQAAFEQAVEDAKKAGAKVSTADWVFSDWDMSKDYVNKRR
ncbi:MAG: extracellular solute-binding protein [candidate division FCPU426 bacterium]